MIVLLSLNCLLLRRCKAKCYRYFISLDFCELIWKTFDEFLCFILHALFYTVILIYSSLHVVFSLKNLRVLSCIFSYMYAFCINIKHWLIIVSTFLCAIFNNSPQSVYVNNRCIVWFDVIKPLGGIRNKHVFTESLTILLNCSVGATVAVDKYVNRSIYIFGFHDFSCFIFAYILGTLKCLITSESIKSIDTTDSLFLRVPF